MNSERWCLDSTGWSERRKRAWKHTDNIAVTFSVGHSARLVVRLPLPLYPQTTTVKQFIHWTACWSSQRSCRLYTEVKETRNYKKAAKRQPGIVRVIRSARLETSQNIGVKMPQPDPNTSLCVLSCMYSICVIYAVFNHVTAETCTLCALRCVLSMHGSLHKVKCHHLYSYPLPVFDTNAHKTQTHFINNNSSFRLFLSLCTSTVFLWDSYQIFFNILLKHIKYSQL